MMLATASFAQNKGKIVKQVMSAATEKTPAALSRAVSGTAAALSKEAASYAANANARFPMERRNLLSGNAVQETPVLNEKDLARRLSTAMALSKNKKVLNYAAALEQERTQARRLAATLKDFQTLNLSTLKEEELKKKISEVIVNNSLQRFLLGSIAEKNYTQFMRDLSNYYSLSVEFMASYELRFIAPQDVREIFAQTALEYMKAHPHKVNLKLREILKSPFVSDTVKASLRSFVALAQIQPQHESAFLTVLREAHKQYTAGLANARSQEDIAQTIAVYKEATAELEAFTSRYHRSPRWNAPMPERRLYNKLLILIMHNQANQFRQVTNYVTKMQRLLTQYPRINKTADETLVALHDFIEANGFFPRAVSSVPPEVEIPEAELDLYESVMFWETTDNNFQQAVRTLEKKFSLR